MDNLPQRKIIRLKHYDYSQEGYYFITICTKNRMNILGNIRLNVGADDPVRPFFEEIPEIEITKDCIPKIELSKTGLIVRDCWYEIPQHYENIKCDEFVIMPNHIHGIIVINGRTESSAPTKYYTRI